MKVSGFDRLLLLLTSILSAYQVSVGIDGLDTLPVIAYTIAFGVLLVAALLFVILGFELLDSPIVVIVSTLIPLSLSVGLVWEHLASIRIPYLVFALAGFAAIILTRAFKIPGRIPLIVLALVHGVAGVVITLLPISFAITGEALPGFAFVGAGGALIGIGGLLLSFLKAGRPILTQERILKVFPGLLLLMAGAFVFGFGSP